MTGEQRIQEIFDSELFTRLFQERPEIRTVWRQKIKPIAGDLSHEGLGLTEEGKHILLNEV